MMIKQLFVIEPERTDSRLLEYAKEAYEINMKVAESLSGTITPQGFAVIENLNMISQKRNKCYYLIVYKILVT